MKRIQSIAIYAYNYIKNDNKNDIIETVQTLSVRNLFMKPTLNYTYIKEYATYYDTSFILLAS
jgi:hypothetical protein